MNLVIDTRIEYRGPPLIHFFQKTKKMNELKGIFFLIAIAIKKKYNAIKSFIIFVPTGFS